MFKLHMCNMEGTKEMKNEPTIFLPSGVHTKPKTKPNPKPNPKKIN